MASTKELIESHFELTVLRNVLSTVQQGVVCFEVQPDHWPVIYANEKLQSMLGIPGYDILAHDGKALLSELVYEEDRERICDMIALGACYQGIVKLYPHQDIHFWSKLTFSPIQVNGFHSLCYIGTLEKEVFSQQLLEQLRDAKIRDMFESNTMGLVIVDEMLRIVEMNDQFLRIIGYSRTDPEIKDITWRKLSPRPPEETLALGTRLVKLISEIGMLKPFSAELIHKDGHLIDVILTGTKLLGHESRNMVFVIDNSKQKRIEHQLEESLKRENLLRKVAEVLNQSNDIEAICNIVVKMLGEYLQVDRCYIRSYHIEPDRVVLSSNPVQYTSGPEVAPVAVEDFPIRFMTIASETYPMKSTIIQVENIASWNQKMKDLAEQLQIVFNDEPIETLLNTFDRFHEKYRVQSALKVDIIYQNAIYGSFILHQCDRQRQWSASDIGLIEKLSFDLGVFFDYLKLQQQEAKAREAEEANRTQKEQLLLTMSHELKTPLNAIIGYSDMLTDSISKEICGDKQRKYCQYISLAGQRLNTIVERLINVIDIDSGMITLHVQVVDLNKLVTQLLDQFQDAIMQKNLEIKTDYDSNLGTLETDAENLRQVLTHLLDNAIKFNVQNGTIHIRFKNASENNSLVCEIEDTGIGIPKENLPEIFTLFYQADCALSRRYEGVGLGLPLAKRRIELCGGGIHVDSEAGRGTKVTLSLPYKTDEVKGGS